jgi:hypothetical protein
MATSAWRFRKEISTTQTMGTTCCGGAKTMSLLVTCFRREAKKRKQDIQRRNRCFWKKHSETDGYTLPSSDF